MAPTILDLIREYGVKVAEKCHCCGNKYLYRVEKDAGWWLACGICDVDTSQQGNV